MTFLSTFSLANAIKQVPQLCEESPKVHPVQEGVGSIDLPAAVTGNEVMLTNYKN